jgi:hypothetical protein
MLLPTKEMSVKHAVNFVLDEKARQLRRPEKVVMAPYSEPLFTRRLHVKSICIVIVAPVSSDLGTCLRNEDRTAIATMPFIRFSVDLTRVLIRIPPIQLPIATKLRFPPHENLFCCFACDIVLCCGSTTSKTNPRPNSPYLLGELTLLTNPPLCLPPNPHIVSQPYFCVSLSPRTNTNVSKSF